MLFWMYIMIKKDKMYVSCLAITLMKQEKETNQQ